MKHANSYTSIYNLCDCYNKNQFYKQAYKKQMSFKRLRRDTLYYLTFPEQGIS